MNKEQLRKLRQEIVLNSLFLNDYENSLGIDKDKVYYFFDTFVDDIYEQYVEEHEGEYFTIQDVFAELDNTERLWEFYNCYAEDPLPIEEQEEE